MARGKHLTVVLILFLVKRKKKLHGETACVETQARVFRKSANKKATAGTSQSMKVLPQINNSLGSLE